MKADSEFATYITKQIACSRKLREKDATPYRMGVLETYREICMVLDIPMHDCRDCQGWQNSCSPDWYPDYVFDPRYCDHFSPEKKEGD